MQEIERIKIHQDVYVYTIPRTKKEKAGKKISPKTLLTSKFAYNRKVTEEVK